MNGILPALIIAGCVYGLIWLWNNRSGAFTARRPDLDPDQKDNRRFDDI